MRILYLWIIALAALAQAASAPVATSKGARACKKDIQRFCKNVPAGEGRIGNCLYGHYRELSRECRNFASHGGDKHVLESLRDLDKSLAPAGL